MAKRIGVNEVKRWMSKGFNESDDGFLHDGIYAFGLKTLEERFNKMDEKMQLVFLAQVLGFKPGSQEVKDMMEEINKHIMEVVSVAFRSMCTPAAWKLTQEAYSELFKDNEVEVIL